MTLIIGSYAAVKSMRNPFLFFVILAGSLFFVAGVFAQQSEIPKSAPLCAQKCVLCHEDDPDLFKYVEGAHGQVDCLSCHIGLTDLEKHGQGELELGPVKCDGCHQEQSRQFNSSSHKNKGELTCLSCHDKPHTLIKWILNRKNRLENVINTCTGCHDEDIYVAMGHSGAALKGNELSAGCFDCHQIHSTGNPATDGDSGNTKSLSRFNATCVNCHNVPDIMTISGQRTDMVSTYNKSYHGKVIAIDSKEKVAGCADCHTPHNILSQDNPQSAMAPENLVKSCGECHPGANLNFVKYDPHAEYTNGKKHPGFFFVLVAMVTLICSVFLIFGIHNFLWWRKVYWERHDLLQKGHICDPELNKMEMPGEFYERFTIVARILHLVLIVAFSGLVITGFPLTFSDAGWSRLIMNVLGGPSNAGYIHRACAVILFLTFISTNVLVVRFLLSRKNGPTFRKRLFGPDSLMFNPTDLKNFLGTFKWGVNKGPEPKFDRWSYLEKMDFFSEYWGMFTIGLTGLLLWTPVFWSKFLPGYVFHYAVIIHRYEAFLAAGFIFLIHFFNSHLIPTKFPIDTVIFTGKIKKYQLIMEKPLHYQRLKEEGLLESYKAKPPSVLSEFLLTALAIVSLIIGLIMTVLLMGSLVGLLIH